MFLHIRCLALFLLSRFGSLSHLKDLIVGGLKIQKLYQEHLVLGILIDQRFACDDMLGIFDLNGRDIRVKVRDFIVEDELRLCLEDEERMLLEQEKNIIEEQRFRVEEAKRMSILGKLTHSKRNHVDIVPGKTNPTDLSRLFHSLDTVWLTPDIERFISQQGHVKCKFPWSDDYTVGQNFWLTLACLDPSRKGWLSEEHIDLWVDYMWHGRPDNANWAMVSRYFVRILLQNSTLLFMPIVISMPLHGAMLIR
ncbi:hypothetical protein Tco_0335283 [Tanacetum coccineum]